jgi:hypothetical protein
MKVFRATTALLIVALLASAPLHAVLLTSDNPAYRRLVYAQMCLYLIAAWLLWHVRKMRMLALAAFAIVAMAAIYINAVHLNYGNGPLLWAVPIVLLAAYAALAYRAGAAVASNGV